MTIMIAATPEAHMYAKVLMWSILVVFTFIIVFRNKL